MPALRGLLLALRARHLSALRERAAMKPVVLYHDNCPDGFTAAWAVWRALGDEAEYRAMNYGQSLMGHVDGRRLIFVDFCLPRPEMEALIALGARVEVYDHHQTAEAALRDLAGAGRVVFDMRRSGAGIAWDEFHQDGTLWLGVRPALIDYVEDRDLWRWSLPDSREVSEYLFACERTFAEWDRIDAMMGPNAAARSPEFTGMIEAGRMLLRSKRQRVATVCRQARLLTFGDVEIPCVNASWDMSELGERLCEQFPEAPAGGYYFDRADGFRQWGFRSRGDFDVSALCARYGGGGHRAAAGFQSAIGWLP